nr:hypothetical protein [Ochrobactrum sp. UNC390CL2Tsu3S39]
MDIEEERNAWLERKAKEAEQQKALAAAPTYHMYSYQKRDGRGREETYWRFDLIENDVPSVHREVNSKLIAMRELEKLRSEGAIVRIVPTPEHLSIEVIDAKNRRWHDLYGEMLAGRISYEEFWKKA